MLRANAIKGAHGPSNSVPTPQGAAKARTAIFRHGVAAHRAGQGGVGSGYDVACSSYGGTLLFRGGTEPTATRIDLPWLPSLALFPGRRAVATGGAVARLIEWRSTHAAQWKEFFRDSNRLVEAFAGATSWTEAARILDEYRAHTLRLGAKIGVSAEITPPEQLPDNAAFKAVGAGSELGVAFMPEAARALGRPEGSDGVMTPIVVAREGVTWSEDGS
jgi:phosphomevalonate kinase